MNPAKTRPSTRGAKIGIASRLALGLLAVAFLSSSADRVAEQGAALLGPMMPPPERSPSPITRAPPSAAPVSSPAARIAPVPAFDPSRGHAPRIVSSDALLRAVDGFEQAVTDRLQQDGDIAGAQLQAASLTLQRQASQYAGATRAAGQRGYAAPLLAAVNSYLTIGNSAVRARDAQRVNFAAYRQGLDAIDALVNAAVRRSFKLFGKVFVKPYLIEMRGDLDDIRTHFEELQSDSPDRLTFAALAASEARLSALCNANSSAILQSQGASWLGQMRDALAQLAASRSAQQSFSEERRLLFDNFYLAHAALATMEIPKLAVLPAPTLRRAPTPARVAGGMDAPVPPAAHGDRYHVIYLWLRTLVFLVVTFLCIVIIRSIVAPLRRILHLAAEAAAGDLAVRIPASPLREFDFLADSLNAMTGQLADARQVALQYQQSLEMTVDERTRQLKELSERDPLTQLPNRRQLFTDLNAALADATRHDRLVGVFFLDLDDFKNVNDNLGHEFGDRVLIEVSRRLSGTAEALGVAARLGGDEFTVLYRDAATVEDIHVAGREIVRALQAPLVIDDREVVVSVSVGASIFPEHEREPEALLRAADAALLRAKALGRNQLAVFTPELLKERSAKLATEQRIRSAVDRGEFELVFQPEICAETQQICLVEALLRWRLPDGGVAMPGEFLGVAEESTLIVNIGDWVMRSAVETAAKWHHGAWPEVRVAVNVSSRQLADARFVDGVRDLLNQYRLPPRCIEIELTETVMQTGPATIESLHRLRAHGVAIALDDFGAGYSSIASLEQLPLSRIKLDRSLVAGIDSSPRCAAIARAIIGLCQGLGLEVTAEGVERPEQLAMLINYRSMFVQGYLLSYPVSRDELIPLLKTHQSSMNALFEALPRTERQASPKERSTIARMA